MSLVMQVCVHTDFPWWVFSMKILQCSNVVFQAISAQDEKLSHTMFLPLAERMVEKMVKEEKIEAEAEVRTFFLLWLGSCSCCNIEV